MLSEGIAEQKDLARRRAFFPEFRQHALGGGHSYTRLPVAVPAPSQRRRSCSINLILEGILIPTAPLGAPQRLSIFSYAKSSIPTTPRRVE